jgi:Leucine-rich repeat (LRR) protein
MFFFSKKFGVRIFCLISEKKEHAGDIKDFSELDLSKIEKLTLPWVACHDVISIVVTNEKKQDFLEIDSIDKNAFVELTNLTCLHLKIRLKLTYDKIDFKHFINLKELCLDGYFDRDYDLNHPQNYLDLSPPPNLEKLTIVYFAIKLNTLTHLKNLNFLHLDKVQALGVSDSKAFLGFANLKHLDFGDTNLVFDCIDSSSLHMGPKSLEVLDMGRIRFSNGQQPKIFFENMPNLKQLQVVVKSLEIIDLVSLKKLSWLENLVLVVKECNDEKELTGVLGNFSKLKKLSGCGLSRVDRDFFKQFPNLESLNLMGKSNHIQSGSFDSLNNLTALRLMCYNLDQLDIDLFKSLTKLVSLYLSQNLLKRIPSNYFSNLAALNELDLFRCQLFDLEPNTFHGLENLNKLTLSLNKLTHLNEASFKGLKNLTKLYLSSNELTEINEEIFCVTYNLIELDLSFNQLIDIRFGLNSQSGLQQLICLDLGGNNLEKFEINLRNLEELHLGSNRTLTRLRPGAFKNLSNLKRLRLDECSLKVVDANTFEGLLSLEHLNLANNGLEDIGVGTFDLMENLKILNLSKNHSLLKYIKVVFIIFKFKFKGNNDEKLYEKLVSNEKPPFYNSLREINPGCVILYEPIV